MDKNPTTRHEKVAISKVKNGIIPAKELNDELTYLYNPKIQKESEFVVKAKEGEKL